VANQSIRLFAAGDILAKENEFGIQNASFPEYVLIFDDAMDEEGNGNSNSIDA
jgi:hypothetical protein